jgi:hypothetical protein
VGFFSFIGKALGTVAKVASSVIPGGGIVKQVAGLAGHLLQHKAPMSATPQKIHIAHTLGSPTLRAQPRYIPRTVSMSPPVLRASPVMPGGSFATPQGIMAPGGGLPPATYGGSRASGGGRKRKRRSASSRRSSHARSGKRRKSGGRKLKFGSPAWRKKYMKRRGR